MALIGTTVIERIINFLRSKGLNDFGIAGVLGNMFAESGLNPRNLQNTYEKKLGMTDEQYTNAVDNADYKYLAYADDFDEDRDKSDDVDLKVKVILQKKEKHLLVMKKHSLNFSIENYVQVILLCWQF